MKQFAECVLPGHPDKICDRIADALVDRAIALHEDALVGIEVAIHRDHVFVDGRVAAPGAESMDVDALVREVLRESGFNAAFPPAPEKVTVLTDLCLGDFRPEEQLIRRISDDQNIVTGFAEFNPAANHLPAAHFAAHAIAKRFDVARRNQSDHFGPDGKVLVCVEQNRLTGVSFSVHHQAEVGTIEIIEFAKAVLAATIPDLQGVCLTSWDDGKTEVTVNGAGDFAVGGPEGDNGLSGKKLVVDAFGPGVPIGGGVLSGKDPHKIDRAAALRARQIAKHLVVAGVAPRALVHLAFVPGDDAPRWTQILLGTDGSAPGQTIWTPADPTFAARWLTGYDLTLNGTFRDFHLQDICWRDLAANGHFWNPKLPWECWNPGGG